MAVLSEPIAVAGTTTPDEWFEGTQPAVGPADTGSTPLTVVDAVDFDEDGGSLVIDDGDPLDYLTVDDETGTITLAEPLAATYTEGERVKLYPPAKVKTAQVMVGDSDEPVEVIVPHELWNKMADGVRPDGAGEVVTFVLDEDDEFVVTKIHGQEPQVDGGYIADETTRPEAWMDGSLYATIGFVDGGFIAGDMFGAHVQMSAAGLTAANETGEQTFQIDALTGNVTTVGMYASALIPNEPHVVIGDLAGTGSDRSFMYFYTGQELDADGVPVAGYWPGEVSSGIDDDGTRYIQLVSPDTPDVLSGQLSIKSSVSSSTRPTLAWSGDMRLSGTEGVVYSLTAVGNRAPLTIQGSALVLDVPNGTMRLNEASGTNANRLRSRDSADSARRVLELEAENVLFDFSGGLLRMRDPANLTSAHGQITAPNGNVSLVWTSGDTVRVADNGGDSFQPIAASAFQVNSDRDNKTDLAEVVPADALDAISGLTVYDYTRTDNGREQRGVIAQDVAEVLPAAVTETDGDLSVELYALCSSTVAAVQALRTEFEALRTQVANQPTTTATATTTARRTQR